MVAVGKITWCSRLAQKWHRSNSGPTLFRWTYDVIVLHTAARPLCRSWLDDVSLDIYFTVMDIGPDEWLAGVGASVRSAVVAVSRAAFLGPAIALFAPVSAFLTIPASPTFSFSAVWGQVFAPMVYCCVVYVAGIVLVCGLGWNRSFVRVLAGVLLGTAGCAMVPVTKAAILFVSMAIDGLNWFAVAVSVHEVVFGALDWRLGVVAYGLVAASSLVLQHQVTLGGTRVALEVPRRQIYVLAGMGGVFGVFSWWFGAPVATLTAWCVFTLVVTSVVATRNGRWCATRFDVLLTVAGAMLGDVAVSFWLKKAPNLLFFTVACGLIFPATTMPGQPWATESKLEVLRQLVAHDDTRAIFRFLLLNSAFMFVQLIYSFRSKSLGLLSDSLHMALDCASLALGLLAGIFLKAPIDPNGKYPFGLKNFETLAGFANGTLLVGISGSIVFEAVGRLMKPVLLQKTTELILVSTMGLGVNLVGIFAFHGHGHGHGHSHGHSHSHSHCHSQSHNSDEKHEHENHEHQNHIHENHEHHDCSLDNDNMRGIFLHILADTLGSVGVVVSTILTKLLGWNGFDPVASIIIAVLIFLSAIPLLKSTASSLLLLLSSANEEAVRGVLNDILEVKGVKSFTTPRFWPSSGTSNLSGYLHVQVYRGENTAYIKRLCCQLFAQRNIEAMVQVESDYDDCWCRR